MAVQIERLRRERDASLKDVVNDVLRRGLIGMLKPRKRNLVKLETFDIGKPRINIDNVAEAIAYAEGEDYK